MGEALFEHAHKPYKRLFKKHRDPLFKTLQSKPISIDGNTYVLVGECRLQDFPLVSHFDIFNKSYESVEDIIGRRVHTFVSQVLLTEHIRKIEHSLKHQVDVGSTELSRVADVEIILPALEMVTSHVEKIRRNEFIEMEDMDIFQRVWDAFWSLYQPRVQALMEAFHAEKLDGDTHVREEAMTLNKLYQTLLCTIPYPQIDSVIEDNYDHGRLRQEETAQALPNKRERKMYAIFTFIYRLLIILSVLIIFGLLLDGESIVGALTPVIVPLGAGAIVKRQIKSRLLSKSEAYYKELRLESEGQHPSISEAVATKKSEPPQQEQHIPRETIHYETKGIVLNHLIVVGMFALVSFATAIYTYIDGGLGTGAVSIMAAIGAGFVAIMCILVRTPLVKQRIVLTDHTIYLRKERISSFEVNRVVAKPNGKTIQIYVDYHDTAHHIRMMTGEEASVITAFETWSIHNRIPFENKMEKT